MGYLTSQSWIGDNEAYASFSLLAVLLRVIRPLPIPSLLKASYSMLMVQKNLLVQPR